jgi:hypothetical protein
MATSSTPGWARHAWRLPLLAGVLLAFGYFPLGLVVPNLVALVPMLIWIDGNLDRSWRAWRNAGLVFGISLNLLILSWMRSMLAVSFLAVFAYLGLAAVFAAGLALATIALAWTRKQTGWPFAVLLPAAWLTLEWAQAQGDLRMTAQHLGQSLCTVPFLLQFADLAGPYGVGLVLLLSSALLYDAWRAATFAKRARALALWGVLAAAILGYDSWAWTHPPGTSGTLRIAFLQPNVPLVLKMDSADDGRQAALAHTGSLAGSVEAFDAVAGEVGVIRADTLDDVVEVTELIVHTGAPAGRWLGAITLSGAFRGLLLDAAEKNRLEFRPLAPATTARLNSVLTVGSLVSNPIDGGFGVLTSADNYMASIEALQADPNVDIVIDCADPESLAEFSLIISF